MKILIPTDFSPLALKAAEYAISLSSNLDAEFVLLHCDEVPATSFSTHKVQSLSRESAMSKGKRLIEDLKKSTGTNANITYDFTEGDPVDILDEYCKTHDIDLVVMGTKGDSALKNRIFGSTAAGVLEHISFPTIFIPAEANVLNKPKHIAFATDLTNIDEEIEELIAFAQFFNATIDVVHVYPDMIDPSTFDEEATKLELVAKTSYPQITFNAVMDSDIIAGLDKFVESDHPDLIAMFTYKSGILEYLFNESYTEEMTMHTKTPLLIMRKS